MAVNTGNVGSWAPDPQEHLLSTDDWSTQWANSPGGGNTGMSDWNEGPGTFGGVGDSMPRKASGGEAEGTSVRGPAPHSGF